MATNEELEVYKQRYETYRHLDKLRWQMLQIAVAVGLLVLAFGKGDSIGPDWWTLAVVGVLLLIFGFVMELGIFDDRNDSTVPIVLERLPFEERIIRLHDVRRDQNIQDTVAHLAPILAE